MVSEAGASNGNLSEADVLTVVEKHGQVCQKGTEIMIRYGDALANLRLDPIRDEWVYGNITKNYHAPSS